ncbi:MAG: hypothetical protein K6357_06365 [Elusimicrobiota bacterium]
MEITTEYFKDLIEIQEIEQIMVEEEKKLKEIENQISEIRLIYENKKSEIESDADKIKQEIIEKKELENKLLSIEESIKKHQIELNQVKKNEEFKALLSEIEILKKEKDEIETKVLEKIEVIEEKNARNKKDKESLIKLEKENNIKIDELNKQKNKIALYLQELLVKQNSLKDNIKDESLKKRFENLLKHKDRLAVVSARRELNETSRKKEEVYFCSGCNMKLTFNDISSLKKSKTFIVCENCSRLVYNKEIKHE